MSFTNLMKDLATVTDTRSLTIGTKVAKFSSSRLFNSSLSSSVQDKLSDFLPHPVFNNKWPYFV